MPAAAPLLVAGTATEASNRRSLASARAAAPEAIGAVFDLNDAVWAEGCIDAGLLELCRLRMADLLGCEFDLRHRFRSAIDAGLTEWKVAELGCYESSPLFSDLEVACLSYAEQFLMDAKGITDEDARPVTSRLAPDAFVAFSLALSVFESFQRLCLVLDLEPLSGAGSPIAVTSVREC